MRLIDAKKLKREIKSLCNPYGKPSIGFQDGKMILDLIDRQPTVDAFVCPVKPGQTVYIPYKSVIDGESYGIYARKVGSITFYENSWYASFAPDLGGFNAAYWMAEVFPTREAAEKRLEEMKGEHK